MKVLKRILYTFLFIVFFLGIFKGWLYRQLVSYRTVKTRPLYKIKNRELIKSLDLIKGCENADIRELILLSEEITSRKLHYTFAKNTNDPNKLFTSETAHCVGYAAYQSAVLNYFFDKKGLKEWKAKPLAAHLYLAGFNLNSFIRHPFFRDHDYVEIKNRLSGETYYTDPTVHDYLWIDFVENRGR